MGPRPAGRGKRKAWQIVKGEPWILTWISIKIVIFFIVIIIIDIIIIIIISIIIIIIIIIIIFVIIIVIIIVITKTRISHGAIYGLVIVVVGQLRRGVSILSVYNVASLYLLVRHFPFFPEGSLTSVV